MSTGGRDALEALLWLAAFIVGLGLIVGFVVWRGRRRGSRTVALDAALTVSAWWLMLGLLGLVVQVISTLTGTEVTLTGARVVWDVAPVPCGYADGTVAEPTLSCVTASGADVTIAGLGTGARVLLAGGQILTALLTAVPALLLATISWQALRGAPFSRTVTRTLYGSAGAVLAFGISAAVVTALAQAAALGEVLPADGIEAPFFRIDVDPLVFMAALALGALGAVFQQGTRLQRETEGLV